MYGFENGVTSSWTEKKEKNKKDLNTKTAATSMMAEGATKDVDTNAQSRVSARSFSAAINARMRLRSWRLQSQA